MLSKAFSNIFLSVREKNVNKGHMCSSVESSKEDSKCPWLYCNEEVNVLTG